MNRSDEEVSIDDYDTATFYCMATSDDSTLITYSWYFSDDSQPLVIDNQTYQFGDTRLSVDTQFDGAERAGVYRCVADNGYSSDVAKFRLTLNSTSGRYTLCCS